MYSYSKNESPSKRSVFETWEDENINSKKNVYDKSK